MKLFRGLGLVVLLGCAVLPITANADIIQFDLIGTAGPGLLPGNEPGSITGGTGGEIGSGITFDNVTNILSINVGWGSSQGFTDLSSNATLSHIHGPTLNNFGNGFTETAGVPAGFTLTRSTDAITGGTITQNLLLTGTQPSELLNGRFYINIHTQNNTGGEMRGFLVVPEPNSLTLLMVAGIVGLAGRRKRPAHA